MESKDILNILKDFEENSTYKKIFINGKWGIGKSYYTNEYIKNRQNSIYISLFGKDSIEIIQEEIAKELFKIINSKRKFLKKGKELVKKISGSISCYGISINSPNIKAKSFIEEYHSILDKEDNLIIVIDDLERKSTKISIEDILGIIEQLSLCKKIKIVLIGDETRINKEDKAIWKSFKEKIIEKEYKISKFSKDAIFSLVVYRLNNYVDEGQLNKFINEFIEKFPIDNLRTINKGVNLFLEISNTYLNNNLKEINLVILKSCMAVAIEKTEKLFEPKKLEENEKYDSYKYFERTLDQDIETRIERHYFNSSIIINKEAFLVHYVLKIFEGNHTENLIKEMNKLIEQFLNSKDEKNIFYLSEDKIKNIITNKYDSIINNKYNYTCLDELIDDIYNILYWYNIFNIEYNENKLKEVLKQILFDNYYNNDKELYENKIDRFSLRYENCEELKIYVDNYNKEAEKRYYIQKINNIEESYAKKQFEIIKLRWIESVPFQENKEFVLDRFMLIARKNNYFISDLRGEIAENEWRWDHYIWNIFYEYLPQKYKDELQNYSNTLKGVNKIQDIRIEALQRNKPLVKNLESNK